jgi:vacuolar protein 8
MDQSAAEKIAEHVRALREGDDAAKTAAARGLTDVSHRSQHYYGSIIADAGGIPLLVELLRDGSAGAKESAAQALGVIAWTNAGQVLIAEAGGIPPLVDLLRDGSAETKLITAWALAFLSRDNDDNKVLIADAGGIAPLVDLLRDGSASAKGQAATTLRNLAGSSAGGNDANAVAIAVAVGFDAVVEFARRGRLTVDNHPVVFASVPAKRKAALVVAALLGDRVPDSVPRVIKAVIGSYL